MQAGPVKPAAQVAQVETRRPSEAAESHYGGAGGGGLSTGDTAGTVVGGQGGSGGSAQVSLTLPSAELAARVALRSTPAQGRCAGRLRWWRGSFDQHWRRDRAIGGVGGRWWE